MDKSDKLNTTKESGSKEADTGGKAARVRRMKRGNSKTKKLREDNQEKLYRARVVK